MDISMPVKNRRSFKKRSLSSKIIRYIVLIIFAIPMVLPLLWMLSTALKNNNSVFAIPPEWIPKEFQISNFATGLIQIDFWSRFSNTMIVSVLCVVGQILSSLSVGYAISRIRFPGRKLWFYLIIGSMMLPGMVSLIPVFHIYSSIGLYNTWWPLIIPAFLGNPFYTFLTRQFMSTIPYSYDEAAKMDGASHLQVLTKVLVPMCKPLIATMAVMAFQGAWNDYMTPLVYIVDPKKWTLSLAMGQFMSGNYGTHWNLFMAADLVYMIPMLVIFFLAQNYFMQGLGSMNASGIK